MGRRQRRQVNRFLEQYLGKRGWAKSVADGEAVDLHGAIPWYTYPAITEIARVMPASAKVFEYGSGNSTLWWRAHADEVVSVEHDPDWYGHVNTGSAADIRLRGSEDLTNEEHFEVIRQIAKNMVRAPESLDAQTVLQRELATEPFLSYVGELMTFPQGYFDVIVIDGMARVACAGLASDWLKPGGLIVFDNSDREEYADAYRFLIDAGFARMDYWGPGPINAYEWCTSIFTKSLEVFQR